MLLIVIGIAMIYMTTVGIVYASVDEISVENAFKAVAVAYLALGMVILSVVLIIKGIISLC